MKYIWLLIRIIKILTSSVSFMNNWIRVTILWHLTSSDTKGIVSRLLKRPLLHLLLASALLDHWNPFGTSLLTVSFAKLLFQHVSINVEDVVSQTISIKIAQNLKSTIQLKSRRLSLSLTISSSVKILKHNILAAVMTIIS